jgi:hypothetical protein
VTERSTSRPTTWASPGSSINDTELDTLVTRIHGANTLMVEHGLGPRLLCAAFGFHAKTPPVGTNEPAYLIDLMKQGTFYPFVPRADRTRDNELELRLRSYPRRGHALRG